MTNTDMQKYLDVSSEFKQRHIGPSDSDTTSMLRYLGFNSLEEFVKAAVPNNIRASRPLDLPCPKSETQTLAQLKLFSKNNFIAKNYIGQGYYGTITPTVIQRNILENPRWYTQYTPYQAEISQGRLEALLNFQTMISDLTGLPIANASLLDEATACAEAMVMAFSSSSQEDGGQKNFLVSPHCFRQTIDVVKTRAAALGINVIVASALKHDFSQLPVFGVLLQYPDNRGSVASVFDEINHIKTQKCGKLILAADILSLALLKSPGELGADIAVGSTQRFGIPMGAGGPHAAYLSCKEDLKRLIPGRLVGISQDALGKPALRLSLQTREQHIRREKALSNICTAQVLLAIMAGMYAVYHGPQGIKNISRRVHLLTTLLANKLKELGYVIENESYFDTLTLNIAKSTSQRSATEITQSAKGLGINLFQPSANTITLSIDETHQLDDLQTLLKVFAVNTNSALPRICDQDPINSDGLSEQLLRKTPILTQTIFNKYHSETELLRYITKLQNRDLSLAHSMIPLGSCTMKLNASTEMYPVSWPEFSLLHPFAPAEQLEGYRAMIEELGHALKEITGFDGISFQPNAGSQGEYAGLLAIRNYFHANNQFNRNVCLIPKSAHGTNPASAVLAGFSVVVVECNKQGDIDLSDLRAKASEHKDSLAALMITYPSTHGIFETHVKDVCEIVHQFGGQVYLDGANMNAMVGISKPGEIGADVCHLNLLKTFCIPHGGGGPGMGPIGVKSHLVPYLPGHWLKSGQTNYDACQNHFNSVSSAPWGSASILTIPWTYITLMGAEGLTLSTKIALLNANYLAKKITEHYPVLYKNDQGLVAHECIIDTRQFKATAGIEVQDIAKRLMDYGFHAPTVSFPVAGTLMIEPTESESKMELDRFIEAMILIRKEIADIESGVVSKENNLLKNAPHTAEKVMADQWSAPYSRAQAAFPTLATKDNKFWPYVARINEAWGDRNLVCTCPELSSYQS